MALMSSRGFDGVTVEEVAAITPTSASTIYRHFGTKEALVLTLGRPMRVVDRVNADAKRTDRDAIRRAVNKVYGKDESVPIELDLVVSNEGLRDQFRREWLDSAPQLASALAARGGSTDVTLAERATAAATVGAIVVALEAWSAESTGKLGPVLDEALSPLAF